MFDLNLFEQLGQLFFFVVCEMLNELVIHSTFSKIPQMSPLNSRSSYKSGLKLIYVQIVNLNQLQ